MTKNENLFNWIDAKTEGFTIAKASGETEMPSFNTCTHICNGLVKAGLLSVTKGEKAKVLTKTSDWSIAKADNVNKERVRAIKAKLKPKPEPVQKSEAKPKQRPKAPKT
jgi:hypothetical protein